MSWSSTAPSLPAGSSYGGKKSGTKAGSNYGYKVTASIARMTGNNVSIKCTLKALWGEGGKFNPPGSAYFSCGGETINPNPYPGVNSTMTRYWTGEVLPGASKSVKIGSSSAGGYYIKLTVKGPEVIVTDIPVFVNDSGTVRKARSAFVNLDDVIEECKVFINVGGVIREIK